MNSTKKKRTIDWKLLQEKYLYLILIFLSLMIIVLCAQDTINYDEFFSVQWCRLSWKELIQTLIDDVHPPLYYFLLKPLFDLTNESMFCARLLSAAAGISLLWTGSLFLERNFDRKSALFYVFFLYFNPFMVQKVTEIRMYILATAFVIISGIMSYYILKNPLWKNWNLFTLFALLAAYTHYYALLSMIFLYAGILIYFIAVHNRKEILRWLFYSFLTIIGYSPWLPLAIKQITSVNQTFWIDAPSSRLEPIRDLFDTMTPYTEHIYLGIIIFLTAISLLLFLLQRTLDNYWSLMCCSALWGTLLLATWYSSQVRPILLSRYLIMALCLSTVGISHTAHYCGKYFVIAVCLYCTVIGGSLYMRYIEGAITQRNTTRTVAFAKENFKENDLILYDVAVESDNGLFGHYMEYYFFNTKCINMEEPTIEQLEQQIAESDGTIWFLDVNHLLSKDNLPIKNVEIEKCGSYGFSSATFEIYRIDID